MRFVSLVVAIAIFAAATAQAWPPPPALPTILANEPQSGPRCVTQDAAAWQLIAEMRVARYTHVYWAAHWTEFPVQEGRTQTFQHSWDILWASIYDRTIRRLCRDAHGTIGP